MMPQVFTNKLLFCLNPKQPIYLNRFYSFNNTTSDVRALLRVSFQIVNRPIVHLSRHPTLGQPHSAVFLKQAMEMDFCRQPQRGFT
jgi:hypothetical protein